MKKSTKTSKPTTPAKSGKVRDNRIEGRRPAKEMGADGRQTPRRKQARK